MTHGYCSNCRDRGLVFRYRIADVGLRWLHADCADRLNALGMHIVPVLDEDQRAIDQGPEARVRVGLGLLGVA